MTQTGKPCHFYGSCHGLWYVRATILPQVVLRILWEAPFCRKSCYGCGDRKRHFGGNENVQQYITIMLMVVVTEVPQCIRPLPLIVVAVAVA